MAEWIVGAEVVLAYSGFSGFTYQGRDTIAKVYKTGNVVLAGDAKQQWRVHGDHGTKAGDGAYSKTRIRLVTPELEQEMHKIEQVREAKRLLHAEAERIEKIARSGDADEILAAALALTHP